MNGYSVYWLFVSALNFGSASFCFKGGIMDVICIMLGVISFGFFLASKEK